MSVFEEFIYSVFQWISFNIGNILLSIVFVLFIYGFYYFSSNQITRFTKDGRLDETVSFLLKRIFRWSSILLIVAFGIAQFGIRIDFVAGLAVLASGTVIGFAAMNTLGNAIAGLILMISRPFHIGDRLFIEGGFADVEDIDLIYTRMKTADNIIVSIPNQKLIQTEIENFGKDRIVRRKHSITAGYEEPLGKVETTLLEAANHTDGILNDPEPFVWITEFQSFAVEYTLYVFIKDLKHIQEIDSALRKSIFVACEKHGIDLSTPSIIRSVK